MVPKRKGDFTDFYALAALFDAGYIETDSEFDNGGVKGRGMFGASAKDNARTLYQISVPPGHTYMVNDCPRESWHDIDVSVFLTGLGILKLEQILADDLAERVRNTNYRISLLTAVLAAMVSAYFTAYFTAYLSK